MPCGLAFLKSLLSPSRIIKFNNLKYSTTTSAGFFATFGVYTVIFVGWSSNSDYCLLDGLLALAQTIAYEDRLNFILFSFIVLICIHNLVHFYSLPTLTPHCAHTAAAFSATSKNYQRKYSLKSRGNDTELTSVE
jgi:hypothetical protein